LLRRPIVSLALTPMNCL